MLRSQALEQARAITSQSLQDDDAIQEYNHMEHLQYLSNVSKATDNLKKKDSADEDFNLEKDGGVDLLSAYGVYSAKNTAVEMNDKVAKYLEELKKQGKSAEDLKAALAEQGGIGATIKKAFVGGVSKAKEKINDAMSSTYDEAESFANEISGEARGIAADGISAAQESARGFTDTASSVAQRAVDTGIDTATGSVASAVSAQTQAPQGPAPEPPEPQPPIGEQIQQAGPLEAPDDRFDDINEVDDNFSQLGRDYNEIAKRPPPRIKKPPAEATAEPVEVAPEPVSDPIQESVQEAVESSSRPPPRKNRSTDAGDALDDPRGDTSTALFDEIAADNSSFDPLDVANRRLAKKFNDKIEAAKDRPTPYEETNESFMTRGTDEMKDFMDSPEGLDHLDNSVQNIIAKKGDTFEFRRTFDESTNLVRDKFWAKGKSPPPLDPGELMIHSGNVQNGRVNLTEGNRAGDSYFSGEMGSGNPIGEPAPVPEEPAEEPTEEPAEEPTEAELPTKEPVKLKYDPDSFMESVGERGTAGKIGGPLADKSIQDLKSLQEGGSLTEADLNPPSVEPVEEATTEQAPAPVEEPVEEAPDPVEQQARRSAFLEESSSVAGPEPRIEPPAREVPRPASDSLVSGLGDAFKSDAEKTAEKATGVFGRSAKVAGKVVSKFGEVAGVGLNAAFAVQSTYEEGKDIFSKHPHLEGDNGWQKAGNLVSMIGDDAAFAGSIARYAGPEGAIIGTGLELAGGAVALVGGGLDAIGDFFEGEKKKKAAPAQAKASVQQPAQIAPSAIQNVAGGGIQNVSASALKQLN